MFKCEFVPENEVGIVTRSAKVVRYLKTYTLAMWKS